MLDRLYVLLDDSFMNCDEEVWCPITEYCNVELLYILKQDTEGYSFCMNTYIDTLKDIKSTNQFLQKFYEKVVFTTQLEFLSFEYTKRLIVLYNKEIHEITLGKCEGTKREIKTGHNLKNLLLAGEFDWFNSNANFQKACEICFKFRANLEGVRQSDYFEFCLNNGICIKDVEKYVNKHYEEF